MEKLKKGQTIVFREREEKIISVSNNRLTGNIVTDKETYSTDFIYRWLEFGFIYIKP